MYKTAMNNKTGTPYTNHLYKTAMPMNPMYKTAMPMNPTLYGIEPKQPRKYATI